MVKSVQLIDARTLSKLKWRCRRGLLALLHPDVKELIKKKVIHGYWNIFHRKHG